MYVRVYISNRRNSRHALIKIIGSPVRNNVYRKGKNSRKVFVSEALTAASLMILRRYMCVWDRDNARTLRESHKCNGVKMQRSVARSTKSLDTLRVYVSPLFAANTRRLFSFRLVFRIISPRTATFFSSLYTSTPTAQCRFRIPVYIPHSFLSLYTRVCTKNARVYTYTHTRSIVSAGNRHCTRTFACGFRELFLGFPRERLEKRRARRVC